MLIESSTRTNTIVTEPFGGAPMTFSDNITLSATVPVFIPADEVYYWSHAWQSDVSESMAALAKGQYADFDSDDPAEVVRWLFGLDRDQ